MEMGQKSKKNSRMHRRYNKIKRNTISEQSIKRSQFLERFLLHTSVTQGAHCNWAVFI